jgi:hypothetical protein
MARCSLTKALRELHRTPIIAGVGGPAAGTYVHPADRRPTTPPGEGGEGSLDAGAGVLAAFADLLLPGDVEVGIEGSVLDRRVR